jgi:kynureninase
MSIFEVKIPRRRDALHLDLIDPLRPLRAQFVIPSGLIYLDGNSLGMLPRTAASRVADVVTREWGTDLIGSWNSNGWFELPRRVGDKIARLIGAKAGEVVATDTTSTNLYKVLSVAMSISASDTANRRVILSERSNFPTDLYIAQSLCAERGFSLKLVTQAELPGALTNDVAAVMLTHVNYRTGYMHDMQAVTAAAHNAGALAVWDLAHSAGAVPVDLHGANADFAVGCGYKYLNGGPGAPAFVWVHPRHTERAWQPLTGWWGHAAPFAFSTDYQPSSGIARYLCGTQSILGLSALDCGVDTLLAADSYGGMTELRKKSTTLSDFFVDLVIHRCAGFGLELVTPLKHESRGSHVSFTHQDGAYAIVQALIARNVVGDFRAGNPDADGDDAKDILRFGFTPLYMGFEDVWLAVDQLYQVLESGEWKAPQFSRKQAVT